MDVFEKLRKGETVISAGSDGAEFHKAAIDAMELRRQYNSAKVDELGTIMEKILKQPLPENLVVVPPFHFDLGFNIHFGKDVMVNYDCVLLDNAEITIGDRVLLAPGVRIVTAEHPVDPTERFDGGLHSSARPVTIGNDVWIGTGAVILPGVTIGDGSTVGAGSVVTHDVAPNTVVVGNPARLLRYANRSFSTE